MRIFYMCLLFLAGAMLYVLKRADFAAKGDKTPESSIFNVLKDNFVPLLFRIAIETAVFIAFFSPDLVGAGLHELGWEKAAFAISIVTQFKIGAFVFGVFVDVFFADMLIPRTVAKIPGLQNFWPQMSWDMQPTATNK